MTPATPDFVGRRIKWLRDRQSVTQEEVAARLGLKDRQSVSDIEAGRRRLAPNEVVAVCELLKISVAELFDPFRLLGEGRFNFRVTSELKDVSEFEAKASTWIATYRELGRQAGVVAKHTSIALDLTKESSFEDAIAAAESLRASWDLGNVPADGLEAAATEHLGILVLYVDAPPTISGAASNLPGLKTILINRTESPARRAFDLAHELFHVMTWHAMAPEHLEWQESKKAKGNRVEQLANNFAAGLLMPESALRDRWSRRGAAPLEAWLRSSAAAMRVSPMALQYRFLNLGLLKRSELIQGLTGLSNAMTTVPRLFSQPFTERVHHAVEAGAVSTRRAAELLGLTVGALVSLCRSYDLRLTYDA